VCSFWWAVAVPLPRRGPGTYGQRMAIDRGHCILPPELLARVVRHAGSAARESALSTLVLDASMRTVRLETPPTRSMILPRSDDLQRSIHTASGTETQPGELVRFEGDGPTGDPATDEAYDGLGATWRLLREAYGRSSIDDEGLPLVATVHYGQDYDNAFWDGTQMVFGDGDDQLFRRFTVAIDVIGHELAHGMTQDEVGLVYSGQSGALNESVSDVFGSLVKQHALGQSASEADWLIGEGLFTDAVQGVALRSMKAPGTAYDDPVLGKDPQPGAMADYVQTTRDNGGVHLNSGIPNRAFFLAATAIGGNAWQGAGQVWYDTIRDAQLRPTTRFTGFARATVRAARVYGTHEAVADAWAQVGVTA